MGEDLIRDVHEGLVYTSDAISARDLRRIYDLQLAAVVDLAAEEPPAVLGRDIVYCRFPLSDDDSNPRRILSSAVLCVKSLVRYQFPTLVSCGAGMSRSPVVSAAAISLASNEPFTDRLATVTADAPCDISPTFLESVSRLLDDFSETTD